MQRLLIRPYTEMKKHLSQPGRCFFRVRGIGSGQKKTVPNETKVERFGADFNFLYIKDYFCFQSGGTIEGQVLF
jgi:hypothetical protein